MEKSSEEATANAEAAGLWCGKCSITFRTSADRARHLTTAPDHFSCTLCYHLPEFDSASGRLFHWERIHPYLTCSYHEICFTEPVTRLIHMKIAHPSVGICHCGLCDGNLPSKDPYRQQHHFFFHGEFGSNCAADENSQRRKENSTFGQDKQKPHNRREEYGTDESTEEPTRHISVWEEEPPDHYAILGVEPNSSPVTIGRAARRKRVETHPDKLKRSEGLSTADLLQIDVEAKQVGWAADILCNTESRRNYDHQLQNWRRGNRSLI